MRSTSRCCAAVRTPDGTEKQLLFIINKHFLWVISKLLRDIIQRIYINDKSQFFLDKLKIAQNLESYFQKIFCLHSQ